MARELFALFLVFWGLLLLLSLATYSQADPSLNHIVSSPASINNAAGFFGAYLSGMLVDFFGIASYLWAFGFIFAGGRNFIPGLTAMWWRWFGITIFGICLCAFASAVSMQIGDMSGGGFLGTSLYKVGWYYLRPTGATLLWLFLFLCSLQLTFGSTWADLLKRFQGLTMDRILKVLERHNRRYVLKGSGPHDDADEKGGAIGRKVSRLFRPKKKAESKPLALASDNDDPHVPELELTQHDAQAVSPAAIRVRQRMETPEESSGSVIIDERPVAPAGELLSPFPTMPVVESKAPKAAPKVAVKPPAKGRVQLPKLDLLSDHTSDMNRTPKEVLESKGRMLIETLADFGLQGELQRITPGPVVTMFEIKPAPGVKVSRIANLSDDLAMALRALSVRIQAPIPGKDSVGIEIPNEHREIVCLRELIGAEVFRKSDLPLTLAIGKDISGVPFATDLAKMPHLLVAGATGQGKSVFINSVLMSLLYRTTPDELKLLLIDPKRIELAVYADMPHLVHPVVTDMSQAKNALDWAVHEMDKRYEAMAVLGVRNIIGYNDKLKAMGEDRPEEYAALESMPYLVIIIDELADLMLTAAKEVETSIVRLAQLARAAGIHLILATQRPSVDVVTGLIKANFPCRISFQVTAKHDSRTILDTVGAEHLLGKGDMLFKAGGGRLQRMHGAFVSDEDVVSVVSFWKGQMPPSYKVDFAEWGNEGTGDFGGMDGNGGPMGAVSDDPMYNDCVSFVMQQGKASISLIQRRFRIGFNRAARYVEQMEQDGIIGAADGSKPRAVIGAPAGRDDF
ncbi:DNA translocase FtsK 4TM domain-containing protein [Desulfovibrio mangrovi]|uniref:DNA translocase FtsK n=1 Tax=Desulfovibrio mangrovi TaxID=2976983 RepID=UPI0022481A9A|nr:DNA translocase FtsK [Desulfovibrio mangrovi]UZP68282.1 DNA translocase FtsK 4TM domain-containing protein [Desulfovibrio mangrovi]